MTTIDRRELVAAIKTVMPAIPKTASNPTYHNIRITPDKVTATNIDTTITVDLDTGLDVLVPGQTAHKILSALKAHTLKADVDNYFLVLDYDGGTVRIPTVDQSTWLQPRDMDTGDTIDFDETLIAAVETVMHATDPDPDSNQLWRNAIHLTDGLVEATDTFRIAQHQVDLNVDLIIPCDLLRHAIKHSPTGFTLTHNDTNIAVHSDGITWVYRSLSSQTFPLVQRIIDQNVDTAWKVTFDTAAVVDVLTRMRALNTGDKPAAVHLSVDLSTDNDQLVLKRTAPMIGEMAEHVDADFHSWSDDMTIGFIPDRLIDMLEASGAKQATLEGNSPQRAAIMRHDKWLSVLMPVRI